VSVTGVKQNLRNARYPWMAHINSDLDVKDPQQMRTLAEQGLIIADPPADLD